MNALFVIAFLLGMTRCVSMSVRSIEIRSYNHPVQSKPATTAAREGQDATDRHPVIPVSSEEFNAPTPKIHDVN